MLASSCSEAARPRTCVVASDAPPQAATARVVWASASVARVEVDPAPGRSAIITRSITFRAEDGIDDRWQSLGLVLGALLADNAPARPEAPPRRRSPLVWIDGGVELGNGLDPGPLRRGGWLRAGFRPPGLPAFLGIGAGYALSDGAAHDVEPAWTTLAVGVGLTWTLEPLHLAVRPRADLIAEHLVAEIGPPNRSDSGSRWIPGGAASLELVWPSRSTVSVVAGGEARFVSGGTAVHVGREKVASFPALGSSVLVGLEVTLLP